MTSPRPIRALGSLLPNDDDFEILAGDHQRAVLGELNSSSRA